jgi:hypothetical protein
VLGVLFSVVACQPQTECEKRIVEKVALDAAALIGKGEIFLFFKLSTRPFRHPGTFLLPVTCYPLPVTLIP